MGGYHGGKTLKERFDQKWTPGANGCWNWKFVKQTISGPRANTFTLNGKTMIAYRASWIMEHGPIPSGHVVRHKCDNPMCVNPQHLELGTHTDNHADMIQRGRRADRRGVKSPSAILTDGDVLRVRAIMAGAPRGTMARLTRELGVNHSTLQDIIAGRTWKHLL